VRSNAAAEALIGARCSRRCFVVAAGLIQTARFLLDPAEASAMVDAMEEAVKGGWYAIARGAGVSEADCATIANAFAYPGFRM
jgi:hypothetical protein